MKSVFLFSANLTGKPRNPATRNRMIFGSYSLAISSCRGTCICGVGVMLAIGRLGPTYRPADGLRVDCTVRGAFTYSQLMSLPRHLLHRGQPWSHRRLPLMQDWHDLRNVTGFDRSAGIGRGVGLQVR